MICNINPSNGIPIYDQIVRHVKYAIANRALVANEHVPSVRELASQIAVNANTVSRAYRKLQEEGVLVSIRGTGMAVSQEAFKICKRERLGLIRERLQSTLDEAFTSGMTEAQIRDQFESIVQAHVSSNATSSNTES